MSTMGKVFLSEKGETLIIQESTHPTHPARAAGGRGALTPRRVSAVSLVRSLSPDCVWSLQSGYSSNFKSQKMVVYKLYFTYHPACVI